MHRGRVAVEVVAAGRGVKLPLYPGGQGPSHGEGSQGKGEGGWMYGYVDDEDSGCYSSVNIPKKRDLMPISYVSVRVLGWQTRHP